MTKNVHGLTAVRTRKGAHIFDHAQHFHVYLAKHFNGLAHVGQRHSRRRGNNYGASYGYGLDQRQLHIAGAGRQIDQQIVQFAPIDAA